MNVLTVSKDEQRHVVNETRNALWTAISNECYKTVTNMNELIAKVKVIEYNYYTRIGLSHEEACKKAGFVDEGTTDLYIILFSILLSTIGAIIFVACR